MGKPVILPATNIGCFMENLKDALVLPIVDALNIVNAMQLLLNDKCLYEKLSYGATNFAKVYLNWKENSQQLKSFYQSILKGTA